MSKFKMRIVCVERTIFDEEVTGAHFFGDEGEFQILPHHFPIMSALIEGEIRTHCGKAIPIVRGVVIFEDNVCTVVVEEEETIAA